MSISELKTKTESIEANFERDLAPVQSSPSPQAVENLRLAYLGRKGQVTALYEGMRDLSKEERPEAGKLANQLKEKFEKVLDQLKGEALQWSIGEVLKRDPIDITLPTGGAYRHGSLHPVTLMRHKVVQEFRRLGFTVFDGPEVEFEFYNFTALNTPEHHPARDMQDTFYIEGQKGMVLRSHTSNIQIHTMLGEKPPVRAVAPGRVFRCDSDPTHTPLFHQIEAFVVDEQISFAHLKGTIDHFLKAIYGSKVRTRLRPSFFPFVEPGAEIDMEWNGGWLEIGGCGMIHPNVFESVGYDSERYSGFAFGFGLDRMAMLYYGINDLRQLFSGNSELMSQFPVFG